MKIKFKGTKNYRAGTMIDIETKTMWAKDEVKEVPNEQAGYLMHKYPGFFEEVTEQKMKAAPENKMLKTDENK